MTLHANRQTYSKPLVAKDSIFREIDPGTFLSEICSQNSKEKHYIRCFKDEIVVKTDKLHISNPHLQIDLYSDVADTIYFSPTAGFGTKLTQTTYLSGLVLEFDVKKHRDAHGNLVKGLLTKAEQDHAFQQILNTLHKQAFFGKFRGKGIDNIQFMPTYVTQTSSGSFHLYYHAPAHIDTLEKRHEVIEQYKKIVSKIDDNLKKYATLYDWKTKTTINFSAHQKWEFDSAASANVVQMMRLPGSKHKRTGEVARVYKCTEYPKLSMFPSWEQMCSWASCSSKIKSTDKQTKITGRKAKKKTNVLPLPKKQMDFVGDRGSQGWTVGNWHGRIFWHCIKLINEGKADHCRDLVSWLAYNSLLQLRHGNESAMKDMLEHIKPLLADDFTTEIFQQYMSTTSQQRIHYKTGEYKHGYPMSMETLNEKLRRVDLPLLSSIAKPRNKGYTVEEIRAAQSAAAHATNAKQRQRTLKAITETITLHANATQPLIAKISNKSLRTVKRYWHESKARIKELAVSMQTRMLSTTSDGVIRSCAIYAPSPIGELGAPQRVTDILDRSLKVNEVIGQLELFCKSST